MSDTSFRAELEIGSSEVVEAKAKVAELQAQLESLKAAEADRVHQVELETMALEHLIETMRFEQAELAALEAARDAEVAAIGRQVAAQLKAAEKTERSEFAHQVELETMALEHEIATLAHEAEQLAATRAAEDALVAAVGQSIGADLAASDATEALTADRTADALALAKETDFERLDASVKKQEAQAARELADAEEDLAAAHRHETEILGIRTTKTGQYGSAVIQAGASTRNWGLAALEASRGIEDLQYGVAGGINNIPTLTMMLGGTAGLTAAISVFAVGTKVAYDHWDDLVGLLDRANPIPKVASDVEGLAKRVDELNERKVTLAVDRHELDVAEAQLKRLKAAQAEFEANAAKQTVDEAEAGKQSQAALQEAGLPKIQAKLKQKYIREQTAASEQSGAIKQAQDVQAEAEEDAKRLEGESKFYVPFSPADQLRRVQLALAQRKIEAAKESARKARQAIETNAETHVGDLIRNTREGTDIGPAGPVQSTARNQLARDLESVGEKRAATQVRMYTPKAIADKKAFLEAEANDRDADAAKAKRERDAETARTKATNEVKHKARIALGDISKSDVQDTWDDSVAKWANAGSKDLEESFDKAKKQIAEQLTIRLKARRVQTVGAEEEIEKTAATLADQAFGRVGRLQTRQAKAAAADAKKEDRVDAKSIFGQLDADAAALKKESTADATRVKNYLGPEAHQQFAAEVAMRQQIQPGMDPNQIAAQVAAEMTHHLTSRPVNRGGATEAGANVAMRQIATRAGFDVTPDSLYDAQRAMQRPRNRRRTDPDGGGMRSVAPAPPAAAPKPKPPAGNQAALDKTLDVTAKTQDAIAAGQTIDHQLLTRLSVLERRTATIEGTNKSLMNRAMESAPTASNSGGSIA